MMLGGEEEADLRALDRIGASSYSKPEGRRTVLNVRVILKVSYFFVPYPYKLFAASLISDLRLASSIASPLTTA